MCEYLLSRHKRIIYGNPELKDLITKNPESLINKSNRVLGTIAITKKNILKCKEDSMSVDFYKPIIWVHGLNFNIFNY